MIGGSYVDATLESLVYVVFDAREMTTLTNDSEAQIQGKRFFLHATPPQNQQGTIVDYYTLPLAVRAGRMGATTLS